MVHNNPNIDLVSDNEYKNLVKFCLFILKILSKNQILTSIMGRNSVANLRNTKINNINVDLANDNVYTKFGLNMSIRSQDIEQNQILTSIKGRNSVANLRKTMIYNTNVDPVNDNVYIQNLVLIGLFVFKILKTKF